MKTFKYEFTLHLFLLFCIEKDISFTRRIGERNVFLDCADKLIVVSAPFVFALIADNHGCLPRNVHCRH